MPTLERIELERKFQFKPKDAKKEIILDDPGAEMSTDEVLSHYSVHYPELTTASTGTPFVKNDNYIYPITTSVGTKG